MCKFSSLIPISTEHLPDYCFQCPTTPHNIEINLLRHVPSWICEVTSLGYMPVSRFAGSWDPECLYQCIHPLVILVIFSTHPPAFMYLISFLNIFF